MSTRRSPAQDTSSVAGTGKAAGLATGLDQTVPAAGRHHHLSLYRLVVPVGSTELGHLPGDLDEELRR